MNPHGSNIEQELGATAQFDRRMLLGMRVLALGFPLFMLGHLFGGMTLGSFVPHLTTWVLASVVLFTSRDGITALLFTNVFWLFLYMTYLYQTLEGQHVNTGFYDPERAARIVMWSQAGLTLFKFLPPGDFSLKRSFLQRNHRRGQLLQSLEKLFLCLGVIGFAGHVTGALSGAMIDLLVWQFYVFIGIRASRMGRDLGRDLLFWSVLALVAYVSIATNSRSVLFGFLLSVSFLILLFKKDLLDWRLITLAVLAGPVMTVFSDVSLAVRYARALDVPLAPLFAEEFLDSDKWAHALNPFAEKEVEPISVKTYEILSNFYSPVFGKGNSGLMERLTLMPIMDITTARFPEWPAFIDWGTTGKIVASVLPSVGQEKELIYSDRVAWDLGLRSRSVGIGRPLMTAQAELFSLGGYVLSTLGPALCVWLINLMYHLMVRLTASRVIAIVMMSQIFIGIAFSSTLLNLVGLSTRVPLTFLILTGTLMAAVQPFFIRKHRRRMEPTG